MTSKDEQLRAMIAEQAGEWFVANDDASLDSEGSARLNAWLTASPLHVQEFLGVAAIARDLHMAHAHPESSLDALLARAQAEEEDSVANFWRRLFAAATDALRRRRQVSVVAIALGVATMGVLLWYLRPVARVPVEAAALHFQTRHGEQQTYRLADDSVLHLNTDTAVTVRYSPTERFVTLASGEAAFEVTHDLKRPFRVLAGPAEVFDIGTTFDVRLRPDSAVVTVVDGRVAVEPSAVPQKQGTDGSRNPPLRRVQLGANQQVTVADGHWPSTPISVDAQGTTSWLHRQIAFDHEPLERVVAEFNRYAAKPIEIVAPGLRKLEVSGTFSTDDPEELIAFLRSLEGVQVEVTATSIRVSQK
jgi:transmembrane sensor